MPTPGCRKPADAGAMASSAICSNEMPPICEVVPKKQRSTTSGDKPIASKICAPAITPNGRNAHLRHDFQHPAFNGRAEIRIAFSREISPYSPLSTIAGSYRLQCRIHRRCPVSYETGKMMHVPRAPDSTTRKSASVSLRESNDDAPRPTASSIGIGTLVASVKRSLNTIMVLPASTACDAC